MNRAAHVREFSFRAGGAASWRAEDVLLTCCDAALAAVVLLVPLFLGGHHPVGRLAYILCACTAAGAYGLRQCVLPEAPWRKSGAEWLIVAVLLLLLLQLTPLAPGLLQRAAPGVVDLLPLWRADGQAAVHFGPWKTISVAPRETRGGLVIFLAHTLVFLTAVQRIESSKDVERLLRWLAWAAAGMATLGLLQYFFGNGKFLWVYMHPDRDTANAVKGSMANQNHCAHFLALGLGPLLWLTHRFFEERRRDAEGPSSPRGAAGHGGRERTNRLCAALAAAAVAAVGFAGLLTFSRGGVAALFVATCVCVGVYVGKKLLGFRSIVGLGLAGVAAAAAILAYGYEPLTRRLGTLQESQSLEQLSYARAKVWAAMLQASARHRLFGSGVGSHAEVHPTYLQEHFPFEFLYGENGYLQVLLETGVAGCVLLGAGIALGLYWAGSAVWRGDRATVARAAPVLGGLAASVVHAVGHFAWYNPACMAVTVVLLACACRLHQMASQDADADPREAESYLPRPVWVGAVAAVLAMSAAMVRDRLPPALAAPHLDRYYALSFRSSGKSAWTTEGETISADNLGLNKRLREHLSAALRRDPDNARAQLRMAVICRRMFDIRQQTAENAMDLKQIRDAALASGFASRKQQDAWLAAAIGENRRYLDEAAWRLRRSLRLCPMQGRAYVYLAELAFLDGLGPQAKHAYIDQAHRLRPHDGMVLMDVGQEAALEGDLDQAMAAWKRAFHQEPDSQQRVIELLAGNVTAEQFLEYFEPELQGLAQIFSRYRYLNLRDDAVAAGRQYAPRLEQQAEREKGLTAARSWSAASNVYQYIGDAERALACMANAVRAAPGDPALRRSQAFQLLDAQRYDDAIAQFQWCLRYNPDDASAQAGLNRALRRGLPAAPVATKPKDRAKKY